MREAVNRRRGYGKALSKEPYLHFNGGSALKLTNTTHNSRMSYEYKVRYNSFGAFMLVCSFLRTINAMSSTSIQAVQDPNFSYTPNPPLELGVPYTFKYSCGTSGRYTFYLDGVALGSGSISDYSRGSTWRVGEYDDSQSFGRLSGDVAYIKLWNKNGTLIRHLIPKEVDGVCGLYDLVGEVFFPPTRGRLTIVEY